jgi:hypothetical protein
MEHTTRLDSIYQERRENGVEVGNWVLAGEREEGERDGADVQVQWSTRGTIDEVEGGRHGRGNKDMANNRVYLRLMTVQACRRFRNNLCYFKIEQSNQPRFVSKSMKRRSQSSRVERSVERGTLSERKSAERYLTVLTRQFDKSRDQAPYIQKTDRERDL